MLKNKHVLVGISGGIAAYKAPMLVRLLKKAGAEVKCVCTRNALEFVTELTLETVSQNKVYYDTFAPVNEHTTEHISLKDWGDVMIVAPATANVIGKLASGIADDALSTLLLAFRKDVFLCPAMNTQMMESPSVNRNLGLLRSDGVHIIESPSGELACGTSGKGRMEEPERIVELVEENLSKRMLLNGVKVLITAGPTYEKIDAVRFVGNFSTGKMGFAVAEELADRGAEVVLIAGPTHLKISHPNVEKIDVVSAREMYEAAKAYYPECNGAILTAAVADFRPDNAADYKIKKTSPEDGLVIKMVQNPDILASLGKMKKESQWLVGFALETTDGLDYAKDKIARKNLDFIVLNSLQDKGAGFGFDTNKVTIIDRDGEMHVGELKTKKEVAKDIAIHIEEKFLKTR